MEFDHLIHNALVLTLEPGVPPLANGYVAVQGDRIAAVGQEASAAELPAAREQLDVQGSLVMPGLINTHTHAAMTLFRGLADDLPLEDWLHKYIFPAEVRYVDAEFVHWGTRLAIAEMLRGGITTVGDGYFFAAAARHAYLETGLRAVMAQGVLDFPVPGVPDPQDNLKVAAEFIDSGAGGGQRLVTSTLFCHAPYTCRAGTLQQAKALTRERNLPFFIHLAETQAEVDRMKQVHGLSPVAYLDSLGILDSLTVAAHAIWVDEADQEILARRGVKVSHCPEGNLKLASGVAPVPELLHKGICVGLGTDGAASNNNLDLFGEMALAAKLHKVIRLDPTCLPAPEVVALATREGARVLGLADRTGTITPGKAADLIILDLDQPHLTPLYDPYSHLVYAARAADVKDVMADGRWLLREREFLTLDWDETRQRVHELTHSRGMSSFGASDLEPPV
ncbi:MAG: amidohydrolase [Deltaproteobacteria bacterium]|nr:amidohydrolase [Deltaproteobacteria bacterium]MBW1951706.1 amidohydrolase [Deltaproteobacteria bacterium]MBW1987577.1 amidohydrolase [Deltaproteobacteria bacterium]MBW2134719.1 amidohydrolase [Deltaproteobacteria bacterium]